MQNDEKVDMKCENVLVGYPMDLSGLHGLNISANVLQYARLHCGGAGIIEHHTTGKILRYHQFVEIVERVAAGLEMHGFQAHDVVDITNASSCMEYLVLVLAIWSLDGAIAVGAIDSQHKPMIEYLWVVWDTPSDGSNTKKTRRRQQNVVVLQSNITESTDFISFNKLATNTTRRSILFKKVSPETIALEFIEADHVTKVTHFEVIVSVERAVTAFTSQVFRDDDGSIPSHWILSCLPAYHPGGLTLGILPAIVLGKSLLLLSEQATPSIEQVIVKCLSNYQVSTLILSPILLVRLSKCSTLRNLESTALRSIVCAGAPTSMLPSVLKGLASWQSKLQCWRVLSTFVTAGCVLMTKELLDPIRKRTSALQELGAAVSGVQCRLSKPKRLGEELDIYEVCIDSTVPYTRNQIVPTGIFASISANSTQLNVVATAKFPGYEFDEHTLVCATLPCEELVASHPLVSDVAVLPTERNEKDFEHQTEAPKISFTLAIKLTDGALKFVDDSLATIHHFIMKKKQGDAFALERIVVVDQIPRDIEGRVLISVLIQKIQTDTK